MKAERLWYRLSTGLLERAPLSLVWLVVSVALMAYPWLQIWFGLWSAVLLSIVAGNLVTLALGAIFGRLHERMASLYWAAEQARRAGDLECAERFDERADRMRWVA